MKQARTALSGKDLLAALAVVVIWGLNFVTMKFALHDFTPFQLGCARYVLAVLPLVFVMKPPRVHWKWVLMYGLFQGVGQFGFLFCAIRAGMTASLASVLMQTQVFFTALFGFVLLRERVNGPLKVGLSLAALGLLCFAMNYVGGGEAAGTTALGFVLNLGAASMWAASNIVARKAQAASGAFDALAFVVWSSLVPIVPFIGFTLAFDEPATRWQWTQAPFSAWLSVAYLGWIATITAGMLVLGESVTPWQWGGVVLVVSALAAVMFGGRVGGAKKA